ncbi:MAG TPA: phage terminase large subunit [Marmoricola sp.]|jgi:phage terminase large subunit
MIAEAPASGGRRLRLSDTQCDFVDDPHPFVLFVGGVGAGKTYAGAARALLRRFGVARPSLGLVVSPSYPMLRDATWRTALDVWAPLVERVVGNEMRLVLKTGDEVIFRSADDPERLRGPNAAWAWIDEAALCHPSTWPITIGRLRQHGELGEAWLTTTPKGMNWVYQTFVVDATDQTAVHRAATAQNPFVDQAFVSSLRSQYSGDFARQELEAEFIADQASALIEWRWLDDARARPATYDPKAGAVVGGLDVAGPGEAETVLCVRQGDAILELHAWLDPDPRGHILDALRTWRHRGLTRVAVDTAGIGHYLARSLQDAGVTVRDVNVGSAPTSDEARERFANLKAEYYWGLRERFKDGTVKGLTDRLLLGQLAGLKYDHDLRGRVKIERKEDAVRRGIKSPDRAEALMLCFAPDGQPELAEMYRAARRLVVG